MKKNLYALLFLLITFSDTYAQNWECIKTDDEYYYGKFQTQSNPDATTRMVLYETIKIDSVYTELDNLVYQNHKAVESTPSCHYTNGPSFLGKKVYSDIQGYFHFINDSTDTLHIKSNAIKDENWVFYLKSSSNLKIIAYIDTIVYDSLFFLPDSVKVIKFYAQNLQGDSIQHTINNKSMKLTKNHGLNSIFDLLKFPETITNYNLVGTKNTNKGYKNFGAAEIWDMEIGDEFHLVKDEGNVSYTGYIRKLIGKQKIGNVLYLNFEEWSTNFFGTTAATILPYRVFTKTIDFENPMIMRWNSLPGESYATDYHGGYFKIYSSPDSVLQEKSHSYPELYRIDPSTDCFYQDIDLYGWTYHHYAIKGAGDDYYRGVYSVQYTEIRTFALKYFKKGDKKYGIPYDYASVMGWSPFNSFQKLYYGRNTDANTIIAEQQLKFSTSLQSHILASFNTIGAINEACWSHNKIGIFGKDILTDKRGTYNLINNHNDTIIFKAYTPLNQEWLFYKNVAINLVIKAKCKSEELASFFGKSDSIRSYSFQAYDLNGVPVDHPVNSKEITLSHLSGFLSTFDFYYFPDSLASKNYTLNGYHEFNSDYGSITSNLPLQEVYNIKVGDRIDLVNTTTFEGGHTVTETIKYLIAKTGSSLATLNLEFRILSKITTYYDQGDSTIQYLQDTITQSIDFTNDFTNQFNKEVGDIM
ncbi:MAG TPA: hypothetical protein VK172_13090, partial [Lentimicrobium sp.]|nr:hypothetical protein [Lentimicrobium sp.]